MLRLGLISCLFFYVCAQAQQTPPVLTYQHSYGGSLSDAAFNMKATPDGGFIVCGSSTSLDGEVSGNLGEEDALIIKYNAAGQIEWQKHYGGSNSENLVSIELTPGGGYIAVGTTNSNNGQVSGMHGGVDIWVIRIDNNGNLLWQKCLGGTLNEFSRTISLTASGGVVICGNTQSSDGDVHDHHFNVSSLGDCWVVNLDGTGNILWTHSYGGSQGEAPGYCQQTPDGGFILTCYTFSNDQDVSGDNNGDIWLVKLNAGGSILWQKCFGGSFGDNPYSLIQVADGYVIGGLTYSSDANIQNHGQGDGWILKTDFSGNLLWQFTYGGSDDDYINDMILTRDGGFLAVGETRSADGTNCKNNGDKDYWVFKTDANGILQWQKSLGGSLSDRAQTATELSDGTIYVDGFSQSANGDLTHNYGSFDQWLIRLSFPGIPLQATVNIQSDKNNVCTGIPVTFTTSTINEGPAPGYAWYINNVLQPGETSASFTSSALQNGDRVYCQLRSSIVCIDQPIVNSNVIAVSIDNSAAPSRFLITDTTVCSGIPALIRCQGNFSSYLWSTGATTSFVNISQPGSYWLEVTAANGCKGKSFINVAPSNCTHGVYIPSAFTPNNDGKNDLFKPIVLGQLAQFELILYNRWGQELMHSSDPAQGWDGKINGRLQNNGVYTWVCKYQISGEPKKQESGSFLLIR